MFPPNAGEDAMPAAVTERSAPSRAALPSAARAAMERLNTEAEGLHIWLRTQANAPSQRSWFEAGGLEAGGRLGRIDIQRIQIIALARWSAARKWLARRS